MKITCGDPIELGMPTATDNCGGDVTLTFSDEYNTDTTNCGNGYGYDIYRTWKATDNCGNMTTSIQAAWIVTPGYVGTDFAFVPENTELACPDKNELGEPICETACGAMQMETIDFIREEDCLNGLSYTRVWKGVDACGNVEMAYQSLAIPRDRVGLFDNEIEDKTMRCGEAPKFDDPVCMDCPGSKVIIATHVDDISLDGCSVTRTWTAMDRCGNMESISQTITRSDSEAPVLLDVPTDSEIICGEEISFAEVKATDACGVAINVDYFDETEANVNGTTITRTWIAVDACGNEARASSTVRQVNDDTPPVFTFVPADKTATCGESIIFDDPVVEDLCSSISISFTDEFTGSVCQGYVQVKRTWIAVDGNGNQTEASSTIMQGDFEAPTFTFIPEDVYVPCGQTANFGAPRTTDNCSTIDLSFTDETFEANAERGRMIVRTFAATDRCGNVAYAKQNMIFDRDTEAPYFTKVPESQNVDCGMSTEFGQPEVADNCSEVNVSFEDFRESGNCDNGYNLRRVWTAVDASGNTTTASQSFTVSKDETAPNFIVVPQDAEQSCGEVNFGSAEAIDNCSNINLTFSDEMYTEGNAEIHIRTWIAVDDCGNESSVSQKIRVEDRTAPNITFAPADKNVSCGAEMAFDVPVVEDNCSEVSSSFVDEEVALDCGMSSISRKWTFKDDNGNEVSTTQTITMVDDEAPVLSEVPAPRSFKCGEDLSIGMPLAIDNCSEVIITFEDEALTGDCSVNYEFRRTWMAVDACGNMATASQEFITEMDDAPPVFIDMPTELSMTSADYESWSVPVENVVDNCSGVILDELVENHISDCDNPRYVYQLTATDECGNAAAHLLTIYITDAGSNDPNSLCATLNDKDEPNRARDLGLSPNLTTGQFQLFYTTEQSNPVTIFIYDLMGRQLQVRNEETYKGLNKWEMDVSDFISGTYILHLRDGANVQSKKFVKVK